MLLIGYQTFNSPIRIVLFFSVKIVLGAEGCAGDLSFLLNSGFSTTRTSRASLSAVLIRHSVLLVFFCLGFLGTDEIVAWYFSIRSCVCILFSDRRSCSGM